MKWNSFSKSAKQPPNLTKLQWFPNSQYKTVHYGFVFPNLPAPLHYFNFLTLLGVPNIPVLQNSSVISTTELDTALVFTSCSLNHQSCLQTYSIQDESEQTLDYVHFAEDIKIIKGYKNLQLIKKNSELQFELNIQLRGPRYKNYPINLGVAERWLCPVNMQGTLHHKQQHYEIESMGLFSYARTIQLPFSNWYFYTRQIVHAEHWQFIFYQIRNRFNQVIHSKLIIFDLHQQKTQVYTRDVELEIIRVYPKVITPDGLSMYLPREFMWNIQHPNLQLQLIATARGDYKFGFGAGYVGSFHYQLKFNQKYYQAEAGYCEYVDCRALKWQEMGHFEKEILLNSVHELACQPLKTPK